MLNCFIVKGRKDKGLISPGKNTKRIIRLVAALVYNGLSAN